MVKEYRNVFKEAGYSEEEIDKRVNDTFEMIFYGADSFFSMVDETMGYIEDTGNNDVRSEGMSYGMMMTVQMDRKKEFDALWTWTKKYMYMSEGVNSGYFAWSVGTDGSKNAYGPAPDGEEFFAMALFFASHRWGDGEGIYNYSKEAKDLLHTCVHKGETGNGRSMWDENNYLIRFITECDFTDPSYHLPHFYELFSKWANKEDCSFWKKAAKASREYLKKACHPVTGLNPEYSTFEGEPYYGDQEIFGRHDWYYSDAYRTIGNIGLDYQWCKNDLVDGEWHQKTANNLQVFFCKTVGDCNRGVYTVDGQILDVSALHPVAIVATNAQASLASNGDYALQCVKEFWDTPLRKGERRYYDNCLYMFAMLALSGRYRIW
ncbi:xylanase [Thiospirochaeta perfilievii]|uniref:cellulase n=1 Tax=Thiospirochaeta perfilievii TaxID=252967 RepID=A0A5C1Q8R7_9SPIO|nr:glycosyl hydrolase family 8 [Thiospirochaeta perfilievii]QEN03440.1 xylanase [Thiospirochaeta perfilievii]